jgi:hypothetical protein
MFPGEGRDPVNGKPFEPAIERELDLIKAWLQKWLENLAA